jgi:transcription antitermination factor NusG
MRDQRDDITWVVVELGYSGEQKIEDGTLEHTLRSDLGVSSSFPVFVPSVSYRRGSKSTTIHLMQGYAFVASGLDENIYFRLENKSYVSQIIATKTPNGIRIPNTVSNREVESLRHKLRELLASDLVEGNPVKVVDGMYKNLTGTLICAVGEFAYVHIKLRSIEILATIPVIFIESDDSVNGSESCDYFDVPGIEAVALYDLEEGMED